MKFKVDLKSIEWWFWFATLIAMIAGLSGIKEGFYIVIAVSIIQFIYFTAKRGFTAFPTQVRLVYGLFAIIGLFDPSNIFYWALLVGTIMVTLFDTCFIARVLILMPWNNNEKLS